MEEILDKWQEAEAKDALYNATNEKKIEIDSSRPSGSTSVILVALQAHAACAIFCAWTYIPGVAQSIIFISYSLFNGFVS